LNSKPEILAVSDEDEDEDDFAIVYSRLVKAFRSNIPFTIVIPHAVRLFKDIPPEKLDVYSSLSQWSCYKTGQSATSDWIKEGTELLREATEEQYRVRHGETNTEITRREKTVFRQELADCAMRKYIRESGQFQKSDDCIQRQMEIAKEEAIREEAVKWEEMETKRVKAVAEEKERLLRAQGTYKKEKGDADTDYGSTYWRIVIGGTAIAGAIIAIMKGYHYI
jgi:hypothetical protein